MRQKRAKFWVWKAEEEEGDRKAETRLYLDFYCDVWIQLEGLSAAKETPRQIK